MTFGRVDLGGGVLQLRRLPAQWRLATGDPDLLRVGPDGIWLRDHGQLAWRKVADASVANGLLVLVPGPDSPRAGERLTLPLGLLDADADEVIDTIALDRVIDEGASTYDD